MHHVYDDSKKPGREKFFDQAILPLIPCGKTKMTGLNTWRLRRSGKRPRPLFCRGQSARQACGKNKALLPEAT
jgi:hypothetical protein